MSANLIYISIWPSNEIKVNLYILLPSVCINVVPDWFLTSHFGFQIHISFLTPHFCFKINISETYGFLRNHISFQKAGDYCFLAENKKILTVTYNLGQSDAPTVVFQLLVRLKLAFLLIIIPSLWADIDNIIGLLRHIYCSYDVACPGLEMTLEACSIPYEYGHLIQRLERAWKYITCVSVSRSILGIDYAWIP